MRKLVLILPLFVFSYAFSQEAEFTDVFPENATYDLIADQMGCIENEIPLKSVLPLNSTVRLSTVIMKF